MDKINFLGLECIKVKFGEINLLLTSTVGPRILSFTYRDSGNIFAELPGEFLNHSEKRKFFFYGGHRLWIAPEIPSSTYLPDNQPIMINQQPDGVELIQKPSAEAGLKKSILIQETDHKNILIIDHFLMNESGKEITVAPWAITQLKLGGMAILPFKTTENEGSSFLPNRSLSLWPYTDIHDARIHINKDFVFITTSPESENPLKIGIPHFQKWIAYFIHGYLFIKYSNETAPDCTLDMGAAGQCYCNDKFLELETLGKYKKLKPGETIKHREVWKIIENPFASPTTKTILDFIRIDKLANYCRRLLQ